MEDFDFVFNVSVPVRVVKGSLFVSNGGYRESGRSLDEFELVYVRQGHLHVEEGDQVYEVGPGQTLIYAPGVFHKAYDKPEDPVQQYWVRFCLSGRPSKKAVAINMPKVATLANPLRMQQLWRTYFEEKTAQPPNEAIIGLIVAQMLCEVGRADSVANVPASTADALASRARAYVQEHYSDPISTSSIAQALDCNPNYLGRAFHRAYGKTVTEYLYDVRLYFAHEDLVYTRRSISEIARRCGFRDRCYFRQVFVKYRGMSPLAYRKRYGNVPTNL